MEKSELEKLKQENLLLREQNERDPLTGLYNRCAVETHINKTLKNSRGGAMLVLDLDHFKDINDKYGHLMGDEVIREAAAAFSHLFWPLDIVGRVGGDEFVAFICTNCTQKTLDDKAARLKYYFDDISRRLHLVRPLSGTLGRTMREPEDDYRTLFDRADEALLQEKSKRHRRRKSSDDLVSNKGICTDVSLIRKDLREQNASFGAYCQDYESFKRIYRFVERGLARSGRSAYVILMTLADRKGGVLPLMQKAEQMGVLHDIIGKSLRSGDVFARYSSCQYLLMVLDTSLENAHRIGERIRLAFESVSSETDNLCLQNNVYPMEPTGKKS